MSGENVEKFAKQGLALVMDGGSYVYNNAHNLPEIANQNYDKAKKQSKKAYKHGKRLRRKLRDNPSSLTFTEIVVIAVTSIGLGSFLIMQMLGFYHRNLPQVLGFFLKLVFFIIIPLVAASCTLLGMYLQERFDCYDETMDKLYQFQRKAQRFVANIRTKFH